MPSNNLIRLASDQSTWRELDQTIADCVSQICGSHDEETVRSFLFLTDILTNQDIDRVDRECAAYEAQKLAFARSPRFESALEAYLNEINPGRAQKRRSRKAAA